MSQIVDIYGRPARHTDNMSTSEIRERVSLMQKASDIRKGQLANSLTGLAASLGANQDNISSLSSLFSSNIYAPLSINYTLCSYLYKTHGILQTMIDEPVEDSWRDGIEMFSQELGAEGIGELEDFLEEKGVWDAFKYAQRWARLYGGGGLVINVGQDPETPLDENDIKRGRLEFYDADRWEFAGAARSAQTFAFYGHRLDASRVITFGGKRAPRIIRAVLGGWGMSELERAVEDFNLWLRGRNVLYEILDQAKIDVYSIKDYASTLLTPEGENTIRKRIEATNQIKNFHHALILDKEDDYKTVTNSFPGLADVMKENRIGVACALRFPMSKLYGISAAGFNSGEDDLESYNGMVTSTVREPAKPNVRKVLRLAMISCFGREYDISFNYRPLRVMSAQQQEEINDKKQQRYERLYAARIIDSQELGELLHKEKLVPIPTKAQQGLLPGNPEVPTAEDMFKPEKQGETNDDKGSDGDGADDHDAA